MPLVPRNVIEHQPISSGTTGALQLGRQAMEWACRNVMTTYYATCELTAQRPGSALELC